MPVEQCSNGKYRIGDGECVYTSRASADRAYRAYLAIEADEEDEEYEDEDDSQVLQLKLSIFLYWKLYIAFSKSLKSQCRN